jgi:predicted anti-sigma-YlaC factor YlaD
MACERWREMLSAQLDGEDDPADRARVDEHLAGCAGCREWLDRAATVNRLTWTGVVTDVPDLSAAILAALPTQEESAPPSGDATQRSRKWALASEGAAAWMIPSRLAPRRLVPRWLTRSRLTALLFIALAAVGAVQLILGLAQVGGGASGEHVHVGVDAAAGHLWHESAAWNVAVGAGYLFIALRRNRPTGLVPMLTAFVGMLLLLSVNDLTADRVDSTRLVSHGFVILGYLLVVTLARVAPETARPPGARVNGGSGWRASFDDDEELAESMPLPPALRLVPRGPLSAGLDEAAQEEQRRAA